jgi:hypothetical protein
MSFYNIVYYQPMYLQISGTHLIYIFCRRRSFAQVTDLVQSNWSTPHLLSVWAGLRIASKKYVFSTLIQYFQKRGPKHPKGQKSFLPEAAENANSLIIIQIN